MIKTCIKCKIEKNSETDYYKAKEYKSGYSNKCKACKDSAMAGWREANRERYNDNMRKMRATNKDMFKQIDLKRTYGISLEDYRKMLFEQGNNCAICKKPQLGKRPLAVDHCHTTNKIRGLLCYGCNRLIVILDAHPLHGEALAYLGLKKAA